MAHRDDGLNMDETERHKDKSTAEIEKNLRYLKIKLTRSIREPKFVLEVVTLIVFVVYALYTVRMYYANRDAADAATIAAGAAQQQAYSTERSLAVTSAAYCQGNPDMTFAPHINFFVTSSPNKVYAQLLRGQVEIRIKDLFHDVQIGETQLKTIEPQPLNPLAQVKAPIQLRLMCRPRNPMR